MQTTVTPRRSFLKTALAAGVAPMVVPASLFGKASPSNRLQLGHIGMGGHGTNYNLKNFLGLEGCRAVAVCDAFRDRTDRAADLVNETYGDNGCRRVDDFREILADPAIDAVVISTPDHWHVPMSMMALEAGKHVFCEKPTYRITEGRRLAEKVEATGLTFATGLEDRSLIKYHKLIEWLRNGEIGDLYHVEVKLPAGKLNPADEPAPVPEGLNWEMWLGPAPFRPYTPTITDWLNWRYVRDFSTGVITDWGTHLCDTGQLAVNDPNGFAVECKAWGQPVPPGMQTDIPAIYEVFYRYSNGVTMSVENAPPSENLGSGVLIKLIGSKGWVSVSGWRGRLAASDPKILRARYRPETSRHWELPKGEHANFLDSVRSGNPPTYPAETLHRLSTTLHMALVSMELGRAVRLDPVTESFVGDPEADSLLERDLRMGWKDA